jgi:hypothetical protein
MNLEGVAEILDSAGVAMMGTSLFINFMPTDYEGVLLRDPFGGTPIDHELPGYRATSFMLIVRKKDYVVAKDIMQQAVEALTLSDLQAGGMQINYMRPRGEPVAYQPSPGGLIEMITNIDCSYVLL